MISLWHDWTWPQIWRDIILVLVWVMPITTLGQAIIHLITSWVSGHQRAKTDIGPAFTKRELWLGIKGICRDVFDILLLIAVTFGVNFRDDPMVAVVSVALTAAAIVALWYGIVYIRVLWDVRRSGGKDR